MWSGKWTLILLSNTLLYLTYPEDIGSIFLIHVGTFISDNTVS